MLLLASKYGTLDLIAKLETYNVPVSRCRCLVEYRFSSLIIDTLDLIDYVAFYFTFCFYHYDCCYLVCS